MDGKSLIILSLSAAIAGLSTDYWIQGIINSKKWGQVTPMEQWALESDNLTFVASLVTSGLAIASVVMLRMEGNKKIPLLLISLALALWIICLVIYVIDDYRTGRDRMRGIIYVVLTGADVLAHFIGDSFKT